MRAKRLLLAALTALLALLLSGCFVKTVDELYTLPQHSDDYNRLEQAIESVMSAQSAVYAAPVSGLNQQSVQLADLDGDGYCAGVSGKRGRTGLFRGNHRRRSGKKKQARPGNFYACHARAGKRIL